LDKEALLKKVLVRKKPLLFLKLLNQYWLFPKQFIDVNVYNCLHGS